MAVVYKFLGLNITFLSKLISKKVSKQDKKFHGGKIYLSLYQWIMMSIFGDFGASGPKV
jgi:hypothetical protein